jgi:hypothetical protein
MSPDPIIATELASGEFTSVPNGSPGPGDTPIPIGRPTLNWLGRITLPSGTEPIGSELLRPLVKVIGGSDSKEPDGGITISSEKEGAAKGLLEGITGVLVSTAGDTEGAGETSNSEKGDVLGITEIAGTSLEGLTREEVETFVSIESKVWQPMTEES